MQTQEPRPQWRSDSVGTLQDCPTGPAGEVWTLSAEPLAQHLRAGGAALFPTDTVPALAALPAQASILWQLKIGRVHV